MSDVHHRNPLTRLDLNLFRVFDVVYRERNLTRAAERLSLSQSAVSHALARMREQLGDPLFLREAQGVAPTPLATRIWPHVQEGLAILNRAVAHSERFEPERDVARVTLAMNDEIEPALLPTLMQVLRKRVPGIAVNSVRLDRKSLKSDLATGRLDLAIDVAQAMAEGLSQAFLMEDDWVVVSRNPEPLRRRQYLAADHVTVSSRRSGRSIEDIELARLGITRRISARCQHYGTACRLVAESDWLLTMPRRLAESFGASAGGSVQDLPIALPRVKLYLFWHPDREEDPASRWLRETLLAAL